MNVLYIQYTPLNFVNRPPKIGGLYPAVDEGQVIDDDD